MSQLQNVQTSDPRFEHDGLRQVTITSSNLGGRGDITLFVPQLARDRTNVPLVILLNGVYGSHWAWALRGGAHRTAARLIASGALPPVLLAMPSDGLVGEGTGYVPQAPWDYERWIVDDVLATVGLVEPSVTARSPLFLAGLSMGGFGALRLAGKYPRRFCAASGHSSVTHLRQLARFIRTPRNKSAGAAVDQSVLEIFQQNRAELPPIRFDCGTEDSLLLDNRALHRDLDAAGIPHEYQEFPGGHDWPYWELHLNDTLRFFAQILSHRAA